MAPQARVIRAAISTLLVATAVLGVVAAFVMPAGLPYDEPAHWSNVLFFAEERRLPILGEPGVSYEGQQTPLYYVGAASLVALLGADAGFTGVRLLGVVGQVVMTGLIAAILLRAAPERTLVIIAGTAFIALNPMLAVMSASVQNDTWALVWGFVALILALRPMRTARWVNGALIGSAASLAILTKVSMAPLLIGLVLAFVLRRRFVEPLVASAVTAVATGWWFVRNLLLYGDLTGQKAVALTGATFENVETTPFALLQTVLTYLTLPTEYVRNTVAAPVWVDAAAVAIGAVLVVGLTLLCVREWRSCDRWSVSVIALVAGVSMIAWVVQVVFGWPVAFRAAFASLPLFALVAGVATQLLRSRPAQIAIGAATSLLQLATFIWFMVAIAAASLPSMLW